MARKQPAVKQPKPRGGARPGAGVYDRSALRKAPEDRTQYERIAVSPKAKQLLKELAAHNGKTMVNMLDELLWITHSQMKAEKEQS